MRFYDPADAFSAPAPPLVGEVFRACMEGDLGALDQLRNCDGPLREDDWEVIENAMVEEGYRNLRFVNDLVTFGTPINLTNPFGTVTLGYDARSQIDKVQRSLEGESEIEDQRSAVRRLRVPVPIFSTGFSLGRRELEATRRRGEGLDVLQFRDAAAAIAWDIEQVIMGIGTPDNWDGNTLSSFLNYDGTDADGNATRNDQTRTTDWADATTDADKAKILEDLSIAEDTLLSERFPGPHVLYVHNEMNKVFNRDWKANSSINVLQRIQQHTSIAAIRVSEHMPKDTYLLADLSPRSVQFIDGVPTQTISWTSPTGFRQYFYVFAIASVIVRQTYEGRTGYVVIKA